MAAFFLASTSIYADHVLKFNLKDGHVHIFRLSIKPEITFAGDKVIIKSAEGNVEYLRKDVVDFSFEATDSKVEVLEANLDAPVLIYNMKGQIIKAYDGQEE